MTDRDFRAQLAGFSLTTAEISTACQIIPRCSELSGRSTSSRFPRLRTFLDFWTHNLEGKLFSVKVAHKKLITPAELRLVGDEFRVH
jgi:uncharacterized protein Usg